MSRDGTIRGWSRIAGNVSSMLTSDALNRATTFVVYALVARYMGVFALGQLALGQTLFHSFAVLAMAGLRTPVTREVAKDKATTAQYLVNGSVVVLVTSLLSISALALLVWLMDYGADTACVILLSSLGLLPYALSTVCESVIRAWEQMHFIALANVPANIAKVGLAFVVLSHGWGLPYVVLVLVACRVVTLAVEGWLVARHICRPRLTFDLQFSVRMVRTASTFLGIQGLRALRPAVVVVLLSKFAGEASVGLYNAANQLLVPVTLVFQSITATVFPTMCRKSNASPANLRAFSENLLRLFSALALPAAAGLFLLADSVLLLVYGKESFLQASAVLRIQAWTLILVAYTQTLGNVLLASHREKVNLRILAVDVLVSLFAGLLLIGHFGLVGAAVTALLVRVVDFLQHYVLVARLLWRFPLAKVLWKPFVASAAMAACLVTVNFSGIFTPILAGIAAYTTVLLLLIVWSHGGPRHLAEQYAYRWSD